ncbi:hypothetical protein PSY81_23590, partial [Shigella flexneri]|nr:hypothetical protein [Shigella flexneri]
MPAPETDTEKLIWSVLGAERPLIRYVHFAPSPSLCPRCPQIEANHLFLLVYSRLQGNSLVEANMNFLEKHQGDFKLVIENGR